MKILEKIEAYLNDNNINYKKIEHEPAASAEEYHNILKTRYEQQAKALLLRYKKPGEKGFVVITLQAQKKVDLNKIKEILDSKSIRLAEKSQLEEKTGCKFGELPPFGKIFGLTLVMDRSFLEEKDIYFNAGSLSTSIVLSPKDLIKLENPILF